MKFDELHPDVQSWIDSDEFVDSIVAIKKEFNLEQSSPLSEAALKLALKEISPENFKELLAKTISADKWNDAIPEKFAEKILLPAKNALMASGIDISGIIPESGVVGTPSEQKEIMDEYVAPETPSGKSPIEEKIIKDNQSPPADSELLSPDFDASPKKEVPPAPFIIHEESRLEAASETDKTKENPLRPIFYSSEPRKEEKAPFVKLEFGRTEKNNAEIDPDNIVNLNDLPL